MATSIRLPTGQSVKGHNLSTGVKTAIGVGIAAAIIFIILWYTTGRGIDNKVKGKSRQQDSTLHRIALAGLGGTYESGFCIRSNDSLGSFDLELGQLLIGSFGTERKEAGGCNHAGSGG